MRLALRRINKYNSRVSIEGALPAGDARNADGFGDQRKFTILFLSLYTFENREMTNAWRHQWSFSHQEIVT